MMYDNNREGILEEYTTKLASECHIDTSTADGKLHLHFIRGLVSDIVDRVAEAPDTFKWTENPKCRERIGPIKNAEECIGVQVSKRSGKPFKSRNKYNTVKAVTVNGHTGREAFTFEEDNSTVDVWICKVRDN